MDSQNNQNRQCGFLRCLRERGLFVAAEAVQDGQIVGAQDEIDDVFLWDVVGVADDEVGHQVFAQKPPGVVVADAEHGAEFREGYHVRVGTETPFIILSCHDRFSFDVFRRQRI